MKLKFIYILILLCVLFSYSSLAISDNYYDEVKIDVLNLKIITTNRNYEYYLENEQDTIILYLKNNNLEIFQNNLILSSLDIDTLKEYFLNSDYNEINLFNEVLNKLEFLRNIDLSEYKKTYQFQIIKYTPPSKLKLIFTKTETTVLLTSSIIIIVLSLILTIYFFNLNFSNNSEKNELDEYIEKNLKLGYSTTQIKLALVKNGYSQKFVEKVFKKYEK